jgi:hypothetical protein
MWGEASIKIAFTLLAFYSSDHKFPHYWSEHSRDKVFGANTSAFSSQFSGFSICHPIYHENTMLLATGHAIHSAAVSTEETATFMLLPS